MSQIEGERPSTQQAQVKPGLVEGVLEQYAPSRTAIFVVAYTMGYAGAVTNESGDVAKAVIEGGLTGAFLYGVTRLVNSRMKY